MRQLDSGGIAGSYSAFSGNDFSVFTLSFGGQMDIAEMGNTKMDSLYTLSSKVQKLSVNMEAWF